MSRLLVQAISSLQYCFEVCYNKLILKKNNIQSYYILLRNILQVILCSPNFPFYFKLKIMFFLKFLKIIRCLGCRLYFLTNETAQFLFLAV